MLIRGGRFVLLSPTFTWTLLYNVAPVCLNKGGCLNSCSNSCADNLFNDEGKEHQGWQHSAFSLSKCAHHVTHSWDADSAEILLRKVPWNILWPSTSFGLLKWMNGRVVTLIIHFAKSLPCVQQFTDNSRATLSTLIHSYIYLSLSMSLCLLKSFSNSFFVVVVPVIAAVAHDTDSTVHGYWYTDRKFTIVVTAVLIILPLSIPKEIGFQKYARYKHSLRSAYFLTQ